MAKVRQPGAPLPRPYFPEYVTTGPLLGGSTALDSSGDRVYAIGRVRWSDGGSHDLRTIHWRSGNATSPSFTLRVGCADVDATAGPPGRDDGTLDQSGTHVDPAGNTNFSTTLSADRASVATGTLLAIRWDFSAYTSGSIAVSGMSFGSQPLHAHITHFDGTSTYTLVSNLIPHLTLEAADGTFGVFADCFPRASAAVGSVAFNSGSTDDEVGMEFTVPFSCWAGEVGFLVNPAASADFDIVLYQATTPVASASFDANTLSVAASARWAIANFADVALTVGQTYRLTMKPTTANNVTINYIDVSAAGHLDAFADAVAYVTADGGTFASPTATRLPFCYVGLSAFDGGGGGATRLVGGVLAG